MWSSRLDPVAWRRLESCEQTSRAFAGRVRLVVGHKLVRPLAGGVQQSNAPGGTVSCGHGAGMRVAGICCGCARQYYGSHEGMPTVGATCHLGC